MHLWPGVIWTLSSSSGLFWRKSQARYHFIYKYFGWYLKRWGLFLKKYISLTRYNYYYCARTHTCEQFLSVWSTVSLFISLRKKIPATLMKWSCGHAFLLRILKMYFWMLPEPPLKKFFLTVKNEPFQYLLYFHFYLNMASFPVAFD